MLKGCLVFFATPHEQVRRGTMSLEGCQGTVLFPDMALGAWPSTPPAQAGVSVRPQWMPCLGQLSSLAKAPLQLLISPLSSRHLFRPGTPDRQPMRPWVVFGTGGDGRTCNRNAEGLVPLGHSDTGTSMEASGLAREAFMGKRQRNSGRISVPKPGAWKASTFQRAGPRDACAS